MADSRGGQATAALVKLDWTPRVGWGAAQVHLGYQARFYHQGYSVYGDTAVRPVAWFPTPQREETLATNALDYVEASDWYHQWSHTVVAETRAPLFNPHLRLDLDLEARAWFFRDVQRPPRTRAWQTDFGVAPLPYAPDPRVEVYGRLALALLPSLDRPDRLRLGLQNTFVGHRQSVGAGGVSAGSPLNNSWLDRRGWFLFGSVEVFL